MKALFKKYFVFTRAERAGSTVIISVICLLLLFRLLLPYYQHPELNMDEQRLAAAWEQVRTAGAADAGPAPVSSSATLFYFDPNTLDSSGFIRLGLSARTTRYLLNWRNKGKQFYKPEDLKALYTLSGQDYQRLAPYISISPRPEQPRYSYPYRDAPFQREQPLPDKLDLNRVDSATLVRIKGIGPFIAHKLIQHREALGGFTSLAQLMDVFRFPDSSYQYLCSHFIINSNDIRHILLNSATEEQLARHPYIGDKMAKNIILLRNGLIKFEKTSQLRQVPLMNEEKYRKIAPYCTID